jgi:hypothetical protein
MPTLLLAWDVYDIGKFTINSIQPRYSYQPMKFAVDMLIIRIDINEAAPGQ